MERSVAKRSEIFNIFGVTKSITRRRRVGMLVVNIMVEKLGFFTSSKESTIKKGGWGGLGICHRLKNVEKYIQLVQI